MKMSIRLSALFVAFALAGCASIGPNYQAPSPAPVTLLGVDKSQENMADFQAAWWKQFNDPILDTLIRRAAKNSPDLHIAIAHLAESRALLGGAKSAQISYIKTQLGHSRSREQQPGFTTERTTITSYQAGFDASWELDVFGGVRRSVEAADADLGASDASLQDVQVSLFAEVARNYFDLRGTQLRLDVARRDIENQQKTQLLIRAQAEVGTGSEQDVASASARLSAVEAQLPSLQIQAHAQEFRLAVLLGERPGELDIDLSPQSFHAIDTTIALGGADAVLARRPDVRIAERRYAAATARIGVARADYFPHISLGGFIGFLAVAPVISAMHRHVRGRSHRASAGRV